ncbi:RA-domain-containing protein [Polychaeton citri CBS 116435]|uniref:RA-domain-containing protein n=1 Tax=Polychaeton citri CBS 116435 TaxID=1314669 RepID=A0A9P4QAM4_9PEZI|nr:RA-domain-containing protein [Polychaeton citri CBS 116435]
MNQYQRHAVNETVYDSSEGDADEDIDSSLMSPTIPPEFDDGDDSDHPSDSEDDDGESLGDEDTPTTQGWADRDGRSPMGNIAQWSEDQVADFVAALSPALKQYGQAFVDEGVTGDALIRLTHEELRELGIASVGHRLTILKAAYEAKQRVGVKFEEGDYVPLSAEGEKADMYATQDDIARIIESIRLRDQRIIAAEAELRSLKFDLDRVVDENRKLREEALPIMRLFKDQRTPLPDPSGGALPSPREQEPMKEITPKESKSSGLSRKFSTKKLFLPGAPKQQPSPTYPPQSHTPQPREVITDGSSTLEASAAATAASNHLTASFTSQTSPNSVHGQLSPTSPAYSTHGAASSTAHAHPPGSASTNRTFPRNEHAYSSHRDNYDGQWPTSAADPQGSSRRNLPTPSPREDEPGSGGSGGRRDRERDRDRDNPQVEIFKSFRVSIDDPCRVVLPVALKRYNITDDWRQYALYIVHGDQERCLGLEEKPLLLFKQLDKEGRKPMFMLRRHASPQEGWSSATGGHHGEGGSGGIGSNAGAGGGIGKVR